MVNAKYWRHRLQKIEIRMRIKSKFRAGTVKNCAYILAATYIGGVVPLSIAEQVASEDTQAPINDSSVSQNNDDAKALVAELKKVDFFSASFNQQVKTIDGELLESSAGKVWAAQPEQLKWQVELPEAQLLLVANDQILHYEEDLEQATIRPYQANLAATPAMILSGNVDKFLQEYSVTQTEEGYLLIPVQNSEIFDRMHLTLNEGLVSSLTLYDGLGQTTHMQFSGVQSNQAFGTSLFTFELPDGTDIYRYE